MARDVMYYFDKKSPFERHELGEIQSDFNMSLTIDGSKDSKQVQVYNFSDIEIDPDTILYHAETQTWWVVKRDIVKRNAHEEGFYYLHNLTLNGAFELLNARDLCDCGFNDNTYTIDDFIKKLFKLSTFEFSLTINYGNNVDETKRVNYIKSFENYTLLSALREFLNGYNCEGKLSFTTQTTNNITTLTGAVLTIIPRTGNVDVTPIDISHFDDVRETRTINKESYGTTVISNAQNVVSTEIKTYPQVGGVRLGANNLDVKPDNAKLRLPSPIYKVESLSLIHGVSIHWSTMLGGEPIGSNTVRFCPWNKELTHNDFVKMAKAIANTIYQGGQSNQYWVAIYNWILENEEEIMRPAILASTVTLTTGWKYNPINHTFVAPNKEGFYFPKITKTNGLQTIYDEEFVLIADKEERDSISHQGRCCYYERGSNEINGFEWMNANGAVPTRDQVTRIISYEYTDLRDATYDHNHKYIDQDFNNLPYNPNISFNLPNGVYLISVGETWFKVNYVPMSDLKIKQDNARNTLDSNVYNQNGKLNDSVALAKLIDSHSKEIQSDNITRFMHYTNFSDIPPVGQLVTKDNELYVVNNISYDFSVNEAITDQIGYYIDCEFTMSKYVSTKSLMVNPNSNIRDYGIPQKYNVKRRQVYRDYFEFSLSPDTNANLDTPYVALDKYLDFATGDSTKEYDHTAIMKIDYAQNVDGHRSWYYQLNSTAYLMGKSLYEVIDFEDNNIIGYDVQNTVSGFNMSELFANRAKTVDTPISYVDDDGRFESITIEMVNRENLNNLYEAIELDNHVSSSVMFSAHPFVGEVFFTGKSENSNGDFIYYDRVTTRPQSDAILVDGMPRTTVRLTVDFEGIVPDTSDLSSLDITEVRIKYPAGENGEYLTGVEIDSVTPVGDTGYKYQVIAYSTDDNHPEVSVDVEVVANVDYVGVAYQGAVDIKDYEIKELDYNKDAIEVPVFEYSLQLGDTEEVEVGENILTNAQGVLVMWAANIVNTQTTYLNASKSFLAINPVLGADPQVEDYDYQCNLYTTYCPVITLEENNTKMRIKFYRGQRALFYGVKGTGIVDTKNKIEYVETFVAEDRVAKEWLIGKEIIIYRHIIQGLAWRLGVGGADDYVNVFDDTDLALIVHRPTVDDFEGNDLILDINYYKLK